MRRTLSALALLVGLASLPAAATPPAAYRVVWDDFRQGFTADAPGAKWFHFSAGPYVGDDGLVTTSPHGLRVVASGTNPTTGEPAFVRTLAPESQSGLPGGIDHVKWLVYTNHIASSGQPGFDAVPGQVLACEGWLGGRTYGTESHPFGPLVDDPEDDLRLASFALNSMDPETLMVFDFFVTNKTIYAFYERLPFAREVLGNYASFSHMIPVASRRPGQEHHLKIEYDREAGRVNWVLDGRTVFNVNRIGFRLQRSLVTLDHGGVEQAVDMRQLNCGMGMFTLLDAYRPTDVGLVKLSETVPTYDPDRGAPVTGAFYDEHSLATNRLWGQGAELTMRRYVVSSHPAPRGHRP